MTQRTGLYRVVAAMLASGRSIPLPVIYRSTAARILTSGLLAMAILPGLSGCIAKTALNVVTAPVKVAGKAVDAATTSQSESDEKRGRELRRREERLGQLERRYENELRACESGDERACDKARASYAEIQTLLPAVPVEAANPNR